MRKRFTMHVRRAGFKIRPALERRLKRLHPRIRIRWVPDRQAWAIVEDAIDGKRHLVAVIEGQPTMEVLHFLNDCKKVNRLSGAELAEWIAEHEEAPPAEWDEARVHEGHDRLQHAMKE